MLCSAAARGREVLALLAVFVLLALPNAANAVCPDTLTDCEVEIRWDLDNLDLAGPSIPILMTHSDGVAGMQFKVTGATISTVTGGVLVPTTDRWTKAVSPTSGIVLVWQQDRIELPAGNNQSVFTLWFSAGSWNPGSEICLTDLAFTDGLGQRYDSGSGPGADACVVLEPNQPPTFTSQPLSEPAPLAFHQFEAPTSPPSATLEGHVDATDRGSVFANGAGETFHWDDQTGFDYDMEQEITDLMPSFQTGRINGLPTIRFRSPSTGAALEGDALWGSSAINRPYTVLGMTNRLDGSSYRVMTTLTSSTNWILGHHGAMGGVMHSSPHVGSDWVHNVHNVANGRAAIYTGASDTSFTQFFVDGDRLKNVTPAHGDVGVLSLGGYRTTGLQMANSEVGEVLIYNSVLDANDIQWANLYLAAKWDIESDYYHYIPPAALVDSSGNGYNATSVENGGLTWDDERGGVAQFQDTIATSAVPATYTGNERYQVSGGIPIDDTWTIGSWFTAPIAPDTNWRTLARGAGGDHQLLVSPSSETPANTLGTYSNNASPGFKPCGYTGMDSLPAGWHHIAAVGDVTETRFYLDGAHICTSGWVSQSDITSIGNHYNSLATTNQRFTNKLDDFAVYAEALSDDQVAAMAVSNIFVNQDEQLSYIVTTTDVNDDTLTISGITVPNWNSGMNLSSTVNGVATFEGTPDNDDVGTHPVLLRVTDGTDTADQAFNIIVVNVNDPPTFVLKPGGLTNIPEDSGWSFTATSADIDPGDTGTITLTASGSNPGAGWLSVTASSDKQATISGTPVQANVGTNDFTLTVTDGAGAFADWPFTLVVTNVNDMPVVLTDPLIMTVQEGPLVPPDPPPIDGLITNSLLEIYDEDLPPNTELVIDVTVDPTNGVIERIGEGPTNQFNRDDILNNRVYYRHDSGESASDSFSFTVTDGALTTVTKSFTITITRRNDVPTLSNNNDLSLQEGSSKAITGTMLRWIDADTLPTTDTLTYTVTGGPSHGTLSHPSFTQAQLDAGNIVFYNHSTVEPNEESSDSFTYTLNDGSGSGDLPGSFDIDITPKNDNPTEVNNGPISLLEGGTEVIGNARLLWDDRDPIGDTLTYTIVLGPTNGSLNHGTSWTQADVPTLAYTHNGLETTSDSFTYTVNDGAGSGELGASGPFLISITPQNDEPIHPAEEIPPTPEDPFVVAEGASGDISSDELLWTDEDIDLPLDTITFNVTSGPDHGTLSHTTFTQAQINAGNVVSYTHAGFEEFSDSFDYEVEDGTDPPRQTGTFTITITPINESPTLTVGPPLAAVEYVDTVNAGNTVFTTTEIVGFDWESPTTAMTYTIGTPPDFGDIELSGAPTGSFTQQQLIDGNVAFQSDGSEDASTTFTLTLDDGPQDGGPNDSPTRTFTINIANTNDIPTIGKNETHAALEGLETDILNTDLRIDDDDLPAANTLILTLVSEPSYGELRLSGVARTAGQTFTQADINAGDISYYHPGDDAQTAATFVFSVSDGNGGTIGNTIFNIDVTSQPDEPVLGPMTPLAGAEDQRTYFTTTNLSISDDDLPPTNTLLFRIVDAPAEGDLELSLGLLSDGDTFTQADVVGGLVSYKASDAEPTGPITFTFRIDDGTFLLPIPAAVYTFTINVAATDDNPTIDFFSRLDVDEGAAQEINTPAEIIITDEEDGPADIYVFVERVPDYGFLQLNAATLAVGQSFTVQDVIDGKVRYLHNDTNDDDSEEREDSFDIAVDDSATWPIVPAAPVSTIYVDVGPINDIPQELVNSGAAIPEPQPLDPPRVIVRGELEYTDVDRNPTDTLTYTLVTNPTKGLLSHNVSGTLLAGGNDTWTQADINAGQLRYIHDGVDRASPDDLFEFTLSDGDGGNIGTQQFVLTVSNTNDQPEVVTTVGFDVDERTLANPGEHVFLQAELEITDDDLGDTPAEVEYTITIKPVNGDLVHSVDGILDNGHTFTQLDINSGNLKYVQDTSETTADVFTFDISDGDTGSLTGLTMPIVINPTNDLPDLDRNDPLGLLENDPVTITTANLSASDNDVLPAVQTLTFTVDRVPTDGYLSVNGGPALVDDDSFTQDDIEAGWVVYQHGGAENATESFDFTLSDGTAAIGMETFTFNITEVNDIPEIGFVDRPRIDELDVLDLDTLLIYTDAESADTGITYTVIGANMPDYGKLWVDGVEQVGGASFTQQQINDGKVEYRQDGSEEIYDSFSFTVSDDNLPIAGVAALDVFEIDIDNVNDTPRELANEGRLLDEGDEDVEIRTVDLEYTDDDHTDPADVTFKVTIIPEWGTLYVNGVEVVADATFTQFQINDGQITYDHDGSQELNDDFTFTVEDPLGATSVADTFEFVMNEINDHPTLDTNETMELVLEGDQKDILFTMLAGSDDDNFPAEVRFTITVPPVNGWVIKDGGAINIITMADILNEQVYYLHDGGETTEDHFTFHITDTRGGSWQDGSLDLEVFDITIQPVNDAPEMQINNTANPQEGNAALLPNPIILDENYILVTDADHGPDKLDFTITTSPTAGTLLFDGGAMPGTFTMQDVLNDRLSYQHGGDEIFTDSFIYDVADNPEGLTLADSPIPGAGPVTFNIVIDKVNDPPGLPTTLVEVEVHQGDSKLITDANLSFFDPDSPTDEIIYTIGAGDGTSTGQIQLEQPAGVFTTVSTFTQEQLDNWLIRYLHDGSDDLVDAFTATVTDASGGDGGQVTLTFRVQIQDCFGVWDGPAVLDVCGICDDDGHSCVPPDNLAMVPGFLLADLSWDTVPDAASFNVYRDGNPIANVPNGPNPSFSDLGLPANVPLTSDVSHCWTVRTKSAADVVGLPTPCLNDTTQHVMELSIDTSGVHGAGNAGAQGTVAINLRNSQSIGSFVFDVEDTPEYLAVNSATTGLLGYTDPASSEVAGLSHIESVGAGPIPPGPSNELAVITFDIQDSTEGLVNIGIVNTEIDGGTVVVTDEGLGNFLILTPGDINCPTANIYDPPGFGIVAGIHPDDPASFCRIEALPDLSPDGYNKIINVRIDALDLTGGPDRSATLVQLPIPGGATVVPGPAIPCNQPTDLCSGGLFVPKGNHVGDWEIRYIVTFEDGVTGPSYPFEVLDVGRSLERVRQASLIIQPSVDGATSTIITNFQTLVTHSWHAWNQGLLSTLLRSTSELTNRLITVRRNIAPAGLKTLLTILATELNTGMDIYTEQVMFGEVGDGSALHPSAIAALGDAEANIDFALETNASILQYDGWFHEQRLAAAVADAEEAISGVTAVRVAHSHALMVDLTGEVSTIQTGIAAANGAGTNMFGATAIGDVMDRIVDGDMVNRLSLWSASVFNLTNDQIAGLVSDQFWLIEEVDDSDTDLLGIASIRLMAVYSVYATVQDTIPNTTANILRGVDHPIVIEMNRRWDVMSQILTDYLDSSDPGDYLNPTLLADFVRMVEAARGDWTTMGDPYGAPPDDFDLAELSNHCLIELGFLSAYVPNGSAGFPTDSRGFYPDQTPVYFEDDVGDRICDQNDHLIDWFDGAF